MVELEQYKFTVNQYKEPMKELGLSLSLSHKHEQIKELESEMRGVGGIMGLGLQKGQLHLQGAEIGRASCRERVCRFV